MYSYREVFSFDKFWGIGSGRSFALGAMYAAYERTPSAKKIAEIGVKAGAEFDKSSALPVRVFGLTLKDSWGQVAPKPEPAAQIIVPADKIGESES